MKKLAFLFILGLTVGCHQELSQGQEDCIDESKINAETMCTKEYMPVCGCDGKTYGNKCEAGAAGLTSWTGGACPDKP